MMPKTGGIWSYFTNSSSIFNRACWILHRNYSDKKCGCRRALVDIPPKVDPNCPVECERRKKKKGGILHKIKLKVIEGGTNFTTPFRRIECKPEVCKKKEVRPKALPPPKPKVPAPIPKARKALQVSVLGADTAIGQYVALLLKQCACIKKLRLYEAKDSQGCNRDLCSVVQDLQHINTNCVVQAYSCACFELERCLQNSDIVLMLESGYLNVDMPFNKRFEYQAPIVKCYADAIANECPKAFVIVCATPIDCMVPLIAETLKETDWYDPSKLHGSLAVPEMRARTLAARPLYLEPRYCRVQCVRGTEGEALVPLFSKTLKETGWYDPRKLLGSLAVPEMRASTLAARALCLEPRYCRVQCVGGTEGEALVPLFSKAVEYFDFAQHNAQMMTQAVRTAPLAVARQDGYCCNRVGDLSEAHALAGLVTSVAHALLCQDVPRVTGFVETDLGHVISPARFIASAVEIGGSGIRKHLGLPKMNETEMVHLDNALNHLTCRMNMVEDWFCRYHCSSPRLDASQVEFFRPRSYQRFIDCAYANL